MNLRRYLSIILVLLVVTPTLLTAVSPAQAQGDDLVWMLEQINALRKRYGVGPLVTNPPLTNSAAAHSNYLCTHEYVDPHREANGSMPANRAAAAGYTGRVSENVVGGQMATKEWAFQWWVHSPIHLANMTMEWSDIGLAVCTGPYGRWYTTDFGVDGGGPTLPPVSASDNATSIVPRPTRLATRVPTNTPTITYTPSITYTPIASFTPSNTPTKPPPTGTPIVLDFSIQPSETPTAETPKLNAPPTEQLVAMVESPVATEIPPLAAAQTTPTEPNNLLRSLIPIGIALQVFVVGGIVVSTVIKRPRR